MSDKLSYKTITGTITCETGLRIGGSSESIEIGGMENPIIRHPITDEPYIPGSSLKGKLRSLLEYKHGRRDNRGDDNDRTGEPCQCGQCIICRVFGAHKNTRHRLGPTRVLFRDASLTTKSKKWLIDAQASKGIFFTEVKTENIIDRNTGIAANKGLRTQERVPAGAEFDFEISVRIFDDDNEGEIITLLEDGLTMLEQDYLGGSGSRGYGKVKIDYQVN